MKILFIVGKFPSLSETFVLNQITGLIDRGHDVHILAGSHNKMNLLHSDISEYDLMNKVFCRRMPNRFIARFVKGVLMFGRELFSKGLVIVSALNLLKYGKDALSMRVFYDAIPLDPNVNYDIIYCHFGPNGKRGMLLKEVGVLNGKLITAFHGYDVSIMVRRCGVGIYEQLFKLGDLFLPISEHWKRELLELGCDEKKVIVHRMGIDCESFSFLPRRLNNKGRTLIVSVGRLVEKKGLEYGIRAVARLAHSNKNVQYRIVGDGPLRGDLERLVGSLGIGRQVHLMGWRRQDEVIKILDEADIFIAPSITTTDGGMEGIPVVIMEAMAKGLPVISTEHSGIPELIEDGVTGFVVPEKSVDHLADRLNFILNNHKLLYETTKNARAFIEKYHNIDTLNDRLVEIFESLTGN